MGTDGTDFHGFLSVLIRKIRIHPCPARDIGHGWARMVRISTDFYSVPIRKTCVHPYEEGMKKT